MKRFAINIAIVFLKLIYRLLHMFPQKNRIVCISRQSDIPPLDFCLMNSYFDKQHPYIEIVILAKQLHNPILYIPEIFKQIYFIATSKAVILDSYCISVSLLGSTIKAPVIQIWHAIGNMKKAGYTALDENSDEARSPKIAKIMHMHEGYDAIAVSSSSFSEDFAAVFNANPSILFVAPLPRVDVLLSPIEREKSKQSILEQYPQLGKKPIIVYCPTFRRNISSEDEKAVQKLIDSIDLDRYGLIYKPHPVSTLRIEDPRVITITGNNPDALLAADYVISDYSTIIYEAGLLNVPVYLYAYDWSTYSQKRGLNIDLEHDVPTLFTNDAKEIIEAIENNYFDFDAYSTFTRNNVSLPNKGTCTENLCEHILEMTK